MNQRFDLTGRTVIITGGGKGIGKVYSEEFAKAGAHVVAADIDGAAAKSVAEALVAQGCRRSGLPPTLQAKHPPKRWRRLRSKRFGAIDVLDQQCLADERAARAGPGSTSRSRSGTG